MCGRQAETKDLIHEGIATSRSAALIARPISSETKDLIHEGIATASSWYFLPIAVEAETKDLIHEGIATQLTYNRNHYCPNVNRINSFGC